MINDNTRFRRIIVLTLLAVIALVAVWIVYSISFIEIAVSNAKSGDITYKIVNQSSNKTTEVKTSNTRLKKRVSPAGYEVIAQQGNQSHFAVVKTRGLFGTTKITASLTPEKSRRFVGNNPDSCMNYVGDRLISYTCHDTYTNIKIHVPATNTMPTYVDHIHTPVIGGSIEGIAETADGTVALVQTLEVGELGKGHYAYHLSSPTAAADETKLSDLDSNKYYTMQARGSGFVVYDTTFSDILYYSKLSAKPTHLSVAQSTDLNSTRSAFDVQDTTTSALYTSPKSSELVITKDGGANRFKFGQNYTNARFCGGVNRVCLLSGKILDVYDVSGKKAVKRFSVHGVINIERTSYAFLAMRDSDILNLDTADATGFIDYSLGSYKYNSVKTEPNGYILSMTNKRGKKIALMVDKSQNDTDSIDKKISSLLDLPEITDVSAYGNYIFYTPDLGSMIYNNALDSYDYDPAKVQAVNNKINAFVARSSFGPNYQIINTLR